jgi:cation:H+ antiporter
MTFAVLNLPFPEMSAWILVILLVAGFFGLTFGGDWLTQGAAALSVNFKINPVVVGLTVVSMATSMPELVTSLIAVKDSPELAIGNILGSNIANIGLILGLTALIIPLAIQLRLIRRDVPILLGVTALFTLFAAGGFNRIEGLVLVVLTVVYLAYVIRNARSEPDALNDEFLEEVEDAKGKSNATATILVLLGGGFLALGADLLVGSSVEIATRMEVSEALIGLTVVAVGTSLPELAASVAAARSGHADICAGNIVGSNLFNLLLIGGTVATISPFRVDPSLFRVEFPAVCILTLLLLLFFKTGHVVSRREGVVLLTLYVTILCLSAFSQMGYLY